MITQAEYGVYALQAFAVVVTFCAGILLVPSLTQSIFSGPSGESVLPRASASGVSCGGEGGKHGQTLRQTIRRHDGATSPWSDRVRGSGRGRSASPLRSGC